MGREQRQTKELRAMLDVHRKIIFGQWGVCTARAMALGYQRMQTDELRGWLAWGAGA